MAAALTLHAALRQARSRLERAGLDAGDAAFDADVLARHVLGGWERGRLVANLRAEPPAGFAGAYEAVVARRERREPAAYIMGVREFWELDISVTAAVLIPRPETELIVEEALNRSPAPGPRSLSFADVGTGSGCLAVALARWLPHAHGVATDASREALAVARRNVDRHGVADRVTLMHADLFPKPIPNPALVPSGVEIHRGSGRPERAHASRKAESPVPGEFDLIVSNPPYVPAGDLASLQPEVRDFEPVSALDGGPDGLDVIRRLVPESAGRLLPGGLLIFEFGFGQEAGVRAIVAAEPRLDLVTIRADYAGIPRVAVTRRAEVG